MSLYQWQQHLACCKPLCKQPRGSADIMHVAGTSVPEVDSVLTTSEVQQLIEQQGATFADLPCAPLDSLLGPGCTDDQLHKVHGGSGMLCLIQSLACRCCSP